MCRLLTSGLFYRLRYHLLILAVSSFYDVMNLYFFFFFFFQAEDGIRDYKVTGVQTCALPISGPVRHACEAAEQFDRSDFDQCTRRVSDDFAAGGRKAEIDAELADLRLAVVRLALLEQHDRIAGRDAGHDAQIGSVEQRQIDAEYCCGGAFAVALCGLILEQ